MKFNYINFVFITAIFSAFTTVNAMKKGQPNPECAKQSNYKSCLITKRDTCYTHEGVSGGYCGDKGENCFCTTSPTD